MRLRARSLLLLAATALVLALSGPVLAQVVQQPPPSATQPYLNVKDFGARGDGATDDTVPIQSAIAAALASQKHSGTIYVPTGSYRITQLLDFATNAQVSLSLVGEALDASELVWEGSGSGIAVRMGRLRGMRIENITIRNNTGSVGTTTGLLLAGDLAGTNNSVGQLSLVRVQAFQKCFVIGDAAGHAVSELLFTQPSAVNCTTGFTIQDGQTTNIWFHGLLIAGCGIGLEQLAGAGSSTYVKGGSASNNTEDFAIRGGSEFNIESFRSEQAGRFATFGTDTGSDGPTVAINSIRNNYIGNTLNANKRAIRFHRGGIYVVQGNHLNEGHLFVNTGTNSRTTLTINDNAILDTTFIENGDVASALTFIDSCQNRSTPSAWYDCQTYYIRDAATTRKFARIDFSNIGATPQIIDMLAIGSASTAVLPALTNGAVGVQKITASGTAPGAGTCKLEVVAGTTAGTCKLVMACGTSGTATTVIDNVGAGC
jgi:hypothetical protein